MKCKIGGKLISTGKTLTENYVGVSGYGREDAPIVKSSITYHSYDIELECGHFGEVWTTGYIANAEVKCKICEDGLNLYYK